MSVNQPDLTGDLSNVRSGVTGSPGVKGGAANPLTPPSVVNAGPFSAVKSLQTRWRPPSFLNIHQRLADTKQAPQASRDLDQAIQLAYKGLGTLENAQACTQLGVSTVTGSLTAIPTGLTTVTTASGSIDNGATAHAFTLTVTPSAFQGCVDIYVWQPTAAGNTTPIAATSAVKVRWVAQGTI